MKTVVITGASTGIGRASAEYLASKGWTVFAGIRNLEDADALQAANAGDIRPLLLDVTSDSDVDDAVNFVSKALDGATLNGLVNNAGIAEMGPLAIQPLKDFEAHFSVNVFGMLRATQAFVPLLGADETRTGTPGRIVNITSVGGRIAAPYLGAYTATKHANEAMTDTLRRELVLYGIDAIAIGPGSVKTPIWEKAEKANKDGPYAKSDWADSIDTFEDVMIRGGDEGGLDPKEVGEAIRKALEDSTPKARYAPVPNKLTNWIIPTRLPKRMLDKIFWKRFGLKQRRK
jgi:NAD(P)-dependent dehydrogenase (short-subunit alcohol dehydrogenase family)